jgi:deoxyribodipyrimidine photolyase-related protein
VYLVEHKIYFDRYSKKYGSMRLNILKPVYHRATMRYYYKYLKSKGIDVVYCDLGTDWIKLVKKQLKNNELAFYDPVDRTIEKELDDNFSSYCVYDTPSFMLNYEDIQEYDNDKGSNQQTTFYKWSRNKLDILMNKGKPEGGKYTYDKFNREKPYNNMYDDVTKLNKKIENKSLTSTDQSIVKESVKYVTKNIPESHLYVNGYTYKDIKNNELGSVGIELRFPINHKGAKKSLNYFIKDRLEKFGPYQDAMLKEDIGTDTYRSILFHSGVSVMINVGLLTPCFVVNKVVGIYNKANATKKKKLLYSVEGFIRQIIGWREFCRYTYELRRDEFINKNFFNSKKKLGKAWYAGTTGIVPIDISIHKAFKYGYLHHIERLMLVANYMTLSEINPRDVFKWFTEFSLDSYDWVMEYNVYCMGTYSDGGVFTSKPYISSSNYILKMSNYDKSEEWTDKWDLRFWKFMKKHKAKIKKMYMLSSILKHADKNIKKLEGK